MLARVYDFAKTKAVGIGVVLAIYWSTIGYRAIMMNGLHENMVDLTTFAQFITNASILLTLLAITRRVVDHRDMVVLLAIGTLLELSGLFTTAIPGLLIWLYELTTGRFGANITAIEVGPKYFVYLILTLAITWIIRRRAERSIARVIVASVSWAMIATTFLFHVLVVNGAVYDLKARRFAAIEAVAKIEDPETFRTMCRALHYVCGARLHGDERPLFDSKLGYANQTAEMIARHGGKDTLPTAYKPDYDISILSPWEGDDRIFEENTEKEIGYLGVMHRGQDGIRAVLDLDWQIILDRQQMIIIVLVVAAHITWVGGGLFLIFLHGNRSARSMGMNSMRQGQS